MELRQYAKIIWKRAWIIALLAILAGVVGFVTSPSRNAYEATLRVAIGVQPEEKRDNVFQYDKYYTFLTSEYLADDFGEIVKSRNFLADVEKELGGVTLPLDSIFGDRSTKKTHRILSITISARNEDEARRISNAVVAVMEKKGNQYLAQLGTDRAILTIVDPPRIEAVGRGSKFIMDMALRAVLGLLAGVTLVFFLEYMDSTVRDRKEVEGLLGLTVLGELPPE